MLTIGGTVVELRFRCLSDDGGTRELPFVVVPLEVGGGEPLPFFVSWPLPLVIVRSSSGLILRLGFSGSLVT